MTYRPPHADMVEAALRSIQPQKVIDLAIVIADALGDDFHTIPYNKAEWVKTRGGEPFRDVNLPFQYDYLRAASEAVRALARIEAGTAATGNTDAARRARAGIAPNDTASLDRQGK